MQIEKGDAVAFMRDVIRAFNARMRTPLTPVTRHIYTDGDTVIVFFDAKITALDGKPYVNTYKWFPLTRPSYSDRCASAVPTPPRLRC